ncbi:MAG: HAD family hydrolase [Candidatus Thermoplasmatota archaeon]
MRSDFEFISFDMDGTLMPDDFADDFWLERIPQLYAEKESISKKEASSHLLEEYDRVGKNDIRWYEPDYWFSKLEIDKEPKVVLEEMRGDYSLYDDAVEAIERLHRNYRLVVISNGHKIFINAGLEGYLPHFFRTYSSVSDFGLHSKTIELYKEVCADLDTDPGKVVHVGDSRKNDYEPSRKAGLEAYLLDRDEKKSINLDEENVLRGLRELIDVLEV